MKRNPYEVLKVSQHANWSEIKSAYKKLVKIHHPDTGGDQNIMIEINAAWEKLKVKNKIPYSTRKDDIYNPPIYNESHSDNRFPNDTNKSSETDEIKNWFKNVYIPIDKLLGQIINPLQSQVRLLSADPYDDLLMNSFCLYITQSKNKIERINKIYTSKKSPSKSIEFSLNLYHCLSQVQDGLNELDRYTMGYVDNYLHDGKAMIKEANKKRKLLQTQKKDWIIL